MDRIYLVVWSGGYEDPAYAAFDNEAEAEKTANLWKQEPASNIEGDSIVILTIILPELTIEEETIL